MIKKFAQYWRTLRYLSWHQIGYYVWRRGLKMPRRIRRPRHTGARRDLICGRPLPLEVNSCLGPSVFRFLNQTRNFGQSIDWTANGQERLWCYNLHYFEWTRQPDIDADWVRQQVDDWIANNPPFKGTGWEPYPVSLRLVNWIVFFSKHQPSPEVIDSLALQAAWLARNLEFHIRANHLFVNIKALVFAGAFFDGRFGAGLLRRGNHLLSKQLGEQFLADGGHYERSPMYHALMTQDLLELAALTAANPSLFAGEMSRRLRDKGLLAVDFALSMSSPANAVALFNDSSEGIAPTPAALKAHAEASFGYAGVRASPEREHTALQPSGYFVVREGSDQIIIDAGDIGPDYQPGHAHCDLLSFEYCLGGRRLIMNCGNYNYEAGAERAFARSTRAHNTVVVDRQDQSEIWGAFRVGRRARPVQAGFLHSGERTHFHAAHNGYAHLPGKPIHHRELTVDQRFDLAVVDRLEGRGEHRMEAWLHFPPNCELQYEHGGLVLYDGDNPLLHILPSENAAVELHTTPRYLEFGRLEPAPSLKMLVAGQLPLTMTTRCHRDLPGGSGTLSP